LTPCSSEKSLNQGFHVTTLRGDGRLVSSMTAPGRPDLSDRVIRGAAIVRHQACGGDLALLAGDDRGQLFLLARAAA
jgi:hypothetical protein